MEIESHKTGAFNRQIESLGLTGSVLFLAEPVPRNLELAARNLEDCKVCLASGLNIVDVLRHEWVVLTEAAAKRLDEVLAI